MVKQSRRQRAAIIKANLNGVTSVAVPKMRTNWQSVDAKASPFAKGKATHPVRVSLLTREAQSFNK